VNAREATPLEEIEQAVQARAKRLTMDLDGEAGARGLRGLVDEEIARWHLEHRRGSRPFDLADPDLVAERALRNLAGYGPLGPLLDDDDVWEIMINAPDQIFVKRHRGRSGYHHEVFHDDDHVFRTLTKILDDASTAHRKLDPSEGLQDAQLDGGARLHIVHNDIARGGHLVVNVRKFTGVPFKELSELVSVDMLDERAARFLRACVAARCSMVIAGAPGSGKTTLLSCAVPPRSIRACAS
jgi:pilus assembly protein CpaF